MILKVKNSPGEPIVITIPAFWAWVCQHIVWILGWLVTVLGPTIHDLPPGPAYWVSMILGGLIGTIGYIKANGKPALPSTNGGTRDS